MTNKTPHISIVDDDESIRESLPDLIREHGFSVEAYSSAEEFLESDGLHKSDCLILDVAMPGMSGPDLYKELKHRNEELPVIFITAHIDETELPRLLEQGAVDCLFKPFTEADLLRAVNTALGRNGNK